MGNDFAGKTVLITGGGSGIGADMALGFAQAGAKVWISGRREEALQSVAARSANIFTKAADVTFESDVTALFDAAGAPDIVIANAGQANSDPLVRLSKTKWDEMLAVNLTGVFLTVREAARRMDAGFGRIIAISSIAGFRGLAYAAHYSAAKHGVIGLVRAASVELADKGITVNAVCPGYIDTEMTDRSADVIIEKTGKSMDEARAILARQNRHNRLITAAEVTDATMWLAGDLAGSVNGQIIGLTGGDM